MTTEAPRDLRRRPVLTDRSAAGLDAVSAHVAAIIEDLAAGPDTGSEELQELHEGQIYIDRLLAWYRKT